MRYGEPWQPQPAPTTCPSTRPGCPLPHLRRLPSTHNDQFAIFQAHQHMTALLGHRHTVDWHFHGQGRHSRPQSGVGKRVHTKSRLQGSQLTDAFPSSTLANRTESLAYRTPTAVAKGGPGQESP